jgi:tetratricopeptide (TPR) repeat protein
MLIGVANLVRAVGRETEARKLAEEAYEKTNEVAEKHAAASMRAAMLKDNDDHIDWLKRADQDDPETKASLSSALGNKAYAEGEYDEAERLIRSSIDDYDKLPETTASLNNSGLTFLTLYGINGDQKDFDEALRRLEKAIQRQPADSILRFNTAHGVLRAVYNDLVDGKLDMKSNHQTASLETLRYLYNDQAEKSIIAERLRNHSGMKKAVSLLENVILLSPKKTDSYATLQAIHDFTRDIDSLKKLKQRVESAMPEAEVEERNAFLAGERDEKYGEMFERAIEQAAKNVDSAKEGTLQHALAVGTWAMYELQSALLGPLDNIDLVVSRCQAAYEAHPCSALRNAVQQSVLQRAHQRLAEANSEYAALATKTRRSLGGMYAIPIAMSQGGELSQIVSKDPDVQIACAIIRDEAKLFPDTGSAWSWAMLRHSDPAFAEQVAGKLKTDQRSRVSREIDILLDPGSLLDTLGMYWGYTASAEHEKAKAVIQGYRDTGGEIPFAL